MHFASAPRILDRMLKETRRLPDARDKGSEIMPHGERPDLELGENTTNRSDTEAGHCVFSQRIPRRVRERVLERETALHVKCVVRALATPMIGIPDGNSGCTSVAFETLVQGAAMS